MQGNAEKALEIVSKLLEELQLPTTKNQQQPKPIKYIALCHRRLGVLCKVAGRKEEAERKRRRSRHGGGSIHLYGYGQHRQSHPVVADRET